MFRNLENFLNSDSINEVKETLLASPVDDTNSPSPLKERKLSKPKKKSTAQKAEYDTQLRGGLTRRFKKRVLPFIPKTKFSINDVPLKKCMQTETEIKSKGIETELCASPSKQHNKSLSFELSSSDSQESEKENDVVERGNASAFVYQK